MAVPGAVHADEDCRRLPPEEMAATGVKLPGLPPDENLYVAPCGPAKINGWASPIFNDDESLRRHDIPLQVPDPYAVVPASPR